MLTLVPSQNPCIWTYNGVLIKCAAVIAPSGISLHNNQHFLFCLRLQVDLPGAVPRLGAIGNDDRFDIPNEAIRTLLRRTVQTEIIDAIQRQEPGEGRLVDVRADRKERRGRRIRSAVRACRCHLRVNDRRRERGEGGEGERDDDGHVGRSSEWQGQNEEYGEHCGIHMRSSEAMQLTIGPALLTDDLPRMPSRDPSPVAWAAREQGLRGLHCEP